MKIFKNNVKLGQENCHTNYTVETFTNWSEVFHIFISVSVVWKFSGRLWTEFHYEFWLHFGVAGVQIFSSANA